MICLDTMALIWGVRGQSKPDQDHMVRRAKALFDKIDQEKAGKRVIIPSLVVAEYLVGCQTPQQRQEEFRKLDKHFRIQAFDLPAAALAAEIHDRDTIQQLKQSAPVPWQCMKADIMIVAAAIIGKAKCIYTDQAPYFKRLAEDRIKVDEIPDSVEQLNLFS